MNNEAKGSEAVPARRKENDRAPVSRPEGGSALRPRKDKGKKPGAFARCLGFAGRRRPLVVASMLLAAFSALASFLPYVAIYLMIEEVIGVYPDVTAANAGAIGAYVALAVGGVLADIGCYLAALLCSHAAAFDAQYRLKLDIAKHLGRIPLGHVARLGTGRISKVMDESVGGIEQFIGHSIPDLAATATAPVALLALLFVFDWRFGLAAIAAVAVACAIQFSGYADKRIMERMKRYQEVKEQMGNAAVEYVRGMRVVKAFGQTAASFRRLADAIKDYTGLSLDVTMFFQNSMPGFTAVLNNAYLFVLPLGILLAPGASDWPSFVMSFVFYLLFVHSVSTVFTKIMYVSEDGMLAQANIDRIDAVKGIEPLSVPDAPATPMDVWGFPTRKGHPRPSATSRSTSRQEPSAPSSGHPGRANPRLPILRRASGTWTKGGCSSAA